MHRTPEQRRERAREYADEALVQLAEELRTGQADDYLYGLALAHMELLAGEPPTADPQRKLYLAAREALEELREALRGGKLPKLAKFFDLVTDYDEDFAAIADDMGWERLEAEEERAELARLEASRDYR